MIKWNKMNDNIIDNTEAGIIILHDKTTKLTRLDKLFKKDMVKVSV